MSRIIYPWLALFAVACGADVEDRRTDAADARPAAPQRGASTMSEGHFELLSSPLLGYAVDKPCPDTVAPRAWQTTACTGNLPTRIPLLGSVEIVHNSVDSQALRGLSRGWRLSIDAQVSPKPTSAAVKYVTFGNGKTIEFKQFTANQWRADLRESRALLFIDGNGSHVLREPDGTHRFFTDDRNIGQLGLRTICDRNGNCTWFARDDRDFITQISIPPHGTTGRVIDLTYENIGSTRRLKLFKDQATYAAVRFAYDGAGNLASVTSPIGAPTRVLYVPGTSLVAAVETALKATFQYAYYAGGVLRAVVDDDNFTTNYTYTPSTVTVSSFGGTRVETFNDAGAVTAINDRGLRTQYGFDAYLRETYRLDPFGTLYTFAYAATPPGALPLPASHLHSALQVSTRTSHTSWETFGYDVHGNVSYHRIDGRTPQGLTGYAVITETTYAWWGLPTLIRKTTLPSGIVEETRFDRDAYGNAYRTVDALGDETTVSWHPDVPYRGLPLSVTDSHGRTTTYSWTPSRSIASIKDYLDRLTTYAYSPRLDKAGLPSTVNRSGEFPTTYTYSTVHGGVERTVYNGSDSTRTVTVNRSITYSPGGLSLAGEGGGAASVTTSEDDGTTVDSRTDYADGSSSSTNGQSTKDGEKCEEKPAPSVGETAPNGNTHPPTPNPPPPPPPGPGTTPGDPYGPGCTETGVCPTDLTPSECYCRQPSGPQGFSGNTTHCSAPLYSGPVCPVGHL